MVTTISLNFSHDLCTSSTDSEPHTQQWCKVESNCLALPAEHSERSLLQQVPRGGDHLAPACAHSRSHWLVAGVEKQPSSERLHPCLVLLTWGLASFAWEREKERSLRQSLPPQTAPGRCSFVTTATATPGARAIRDDLRCTRRCARTSRYFSLAGSSQQNLLLNCSIKLVAARLW